MQTRSPALRSLAAPIAFALACVMIALLLWRTFGGSFPLEPKGYRFSVVMPQATNLQPGADVRTAGITIGKVASVARAGAGARVLVELEPQYAPLRADARVMMRNKSLLGEAFLGLSRGSPRVRAVPDGGVLSPRRVEPQQRIDDYLSAFDPSTRGSIRRWLRGFAAGLRGRSQDLNDAIGWAAPLTANLGDLMDQLNRQRTALQQGINSSGAVLESIGRREGVVHAAITQGNLFFQVSAQRRRDVTAMFRAFPPFLHELTATARTGEAVSGDLLRAATSLEPVAPLMGPALTQSKALAPPLRSVFHALPSTQSAGVRGLPALTKIARATPQAVAQLYPAARQLIPLLDLAGQNIDSIIGPLANFGSANNGTGGAAMYDAAGVPAHFSRSSMMWWNESVAGYEKPPPTNRQNAYPAPGSLTDVGKGGLKAWDCKNLNNPQLIPPFGPDAGAPPCRVQGPWNFEGRSAYFPHLLEAPP